MQKRPRKLIEKPDRKKSALYRRSYSTIPYGIYFRNGFYEVRRASEAGEMNPML